MMLGKAKVYVLDQLLLEFYRGKVGRGLVLETSGQHDYSTRVESLFTPALTVYSQDSETRSRTGHNGRYKQQLVVERRECRAWT